MQFERINAILENALLLSQDKRQQLRVSNKEWVENIDFRYI